MKILLAVDGSRYATWATEFLLQLPLRGEPEITVLHVVEPKALDLPQDLLAQPAMKQRQEELEQWLREQTEAAQQLVEETAEQLKTCWTQVSALVERGPVAEKVIETAQHTSADVIALGARGRSDIESFLLGSVAFKVATYAPCSVLVVKRHVSAFQKILVAVDGFVHAERAIAFLKTHLRPEGLEVHTLYVWEYPFHAPQLPEEATVEGKSRRMLAEAGFQAQALLAEGHPAQRIVGITEQKGVHLVVVGSRGLTGLKRILLGSVSHKVVKYSGRSVLVVRG